MKIRKTNMKSNRFGARKYAKIKSSEGNSEYIVAKVRKRNKKDYKYVCSCPDFIYRQHKCKHILQFISGEKNC